MSASVKLDKLIKSLQVMPGIGPRSATRIAYDFLNRKREAGVELANILTDAMQSITLCPCCRDYADSDNECLICSNIKRRQEGILCIVESPVDVQAIESTQTFFGTYFVLHGHLSPIDGIGPNELGIHLLEERLKNESIKEIIIATNPTIEGDATASYIALIAKKYNIMATKIASGVPLGGELDAIDEHTIAASINHRRKL